MEVLGLPVAYGVLQHLQRLAVAFESCNRVERDGGDGELTAEDISAALSCLSLVDDAERLCGKLNKRLGLTPEQWTALAAQSMCAETPEPGHPTER